MDLGKLNVVDSCINQRLDMSDELLSIILVPADDALSTSGMQWEVSRTVFREQSGNATLVSFVDAPA